ncbi:hypothetical protein [Caryophanon tenue]|uniref:Uncharacterized protein n=1 Tax=Caryophanon tenue TaxID=33978 RepID=A0A1C0YMH3_9BACL|nr:hypothetical protein [Caryophanon tenue]OCS88375.1 hypothetical protein A6M13_00585 [Caryophanon tenue]
MQISMKILLLILYSFPFMGIAMYIDFQRHSMLGYAMTMLATLALTYVAIKRSALFIIITGNIFSAIFSYILVQMMATYEGWDGFFKPLSALQLLFVVTILYMMLQWIVIHLVKQTVSPTQ